MQNLEKGENFGYSLVLAVLFSWERYGCCEEEETVFCTLGDDIRLCATNWDYHNSGDRRRQSCRLQLLSRLVGWQMSKSDKTSGRVQA